MAFWDRWLKPESEPPPAGSARGMTLPEGIKATAIDSIASSYRDRMAWGSVEDSRQYAMPLGDYQSKSSAVFACVNERAKSLSHLPLQLWKEDNQGVRRLITSGKAYDVLRRVNPYWTGQKLIDATERALCFYGKSFWFIERRGKGLPPNLWWIKPKNMQVVPGTGYVEGYLYRDQGKDIPFRPDEIIWIPYFWTENEFEGLSPLSAARLAADTSIEALQANRKFFKNGMHLGGIISPKEEGIRFSPEQAKQLEQDFHRRLGGADKAHRWLVLNGAVDARPLGVEPKDAEFLGLMGWGTTEVCSVYSTPPAIISHYVQGGIVDPEAALRLWWTICLIPEGKFLASEITEKLLTLPDFAGEADYAEFDTSGVQVLQKNQTEVVGQMAMLFNMRVPLNPLLREFMPSLIPPGTNGFPWGDDPLELPGITGLATPSQQGRGFKAVSIQPVPVDPGWRNTPAGQEYLKVAKAGPMPVDDGSAAASLQKLVWLLKSGEVAIEDNAIPSYGSDAHKAHMDAYEKALGPHEKKFKALITSLFEKQRDAILDRAKGLYQVAPGQYGPEWSVGRPDALQKALDTDDPFDRDEAEEEFAETATPLLGQIQRTAGDAALRRVNAGFSFDVDNPRAQAKLRAQAQAFARHVNDTTYEALKESLTEGVKLGEGIPELEARVEAVMGDRIASSVETIARTETGRAYSAGELEGYKQSGVVDKKVWLATIDQGTRDAHLAMHGQIVDLEDDFTAPGGAKAPVPLEFGIPEHDINCRCSTTVVVKSGDARHYVPIGVNGTH